MTEKPYIDTGYQTPLTPFRAVQDACVDTVSDMVWELSDSILTLSDWDCNIRKVMIGSNSSQLIVTLTNDCPPTVLAGSYDPLTTFFGDTYGYVYGWNAKNGTTKLKIWQHKGLCTGVKFSADLGALVSTGSDGVIHVADIRSGKGVCGINVPTKITCLDMKNNVMCIGGQNGMVEMFDVRMMRPMTTSVAGQNKCLKSMPLCVSVFPDGRGCSYGLVNGSVSNYFFTDSTANYDFQTTQEGASIVYPVNTINFRGDGSLFTAGGDGYMNFWDIFSYKKLYSLRPILPEFAVTASTYSPDGDFIAMALGYDWSQVC